MISKLVRHSNVAIIGYDIEFFFLKFTVTISDYDIEKHFKIFLVNVAVIDYDINLKKFIMTNALFWTLICFSNYFNNFCKICINLV